jgi:hypothetical protein
MKNQYYEMTVPVFTKMLANLDHLLSKGATYAVENGISDEVLLGSRLTPDMFPLTKQIQIATDNAKGAVARLCGIEAPVMEDTETTVAQLHERIAKTIAFITSVTEVQFEGAESRHIFIKWYPEQHFTALDYLTQYAIPNFFFHTTIAYALLRALGANIGKQDYLGPLSLQSN